MKMLRIYNENLYQELKEKVERQNKIDNSKTTISEYIENILEDYIISSNHTYDIRLMNLEKQNESLNDKLNENIKLLIEINDLYQSILNEILLDPVHIESDVNNE